MIYYFIEYDFVYKNIERILVMVTQYKNLFNDDMTVTYIYGVDDAMKIIAEESFDYYKNAFDRNSAKSEEDYRKLVISSAIENIIERSPYVSILKALEKEYGQFKIVTRHNGKVSTILSGQDVSCELSHPNLKLYPKSYRSHMFSINKFKKASDMDYIVYGTSLEDTAFQYVNKCLDKEYLVRYINGNGEGYATAKVREIIFKEYLNNPEIKLECIR